MRVTRPCGSVASTASPIERSVIARLCSLRARASRAVSTFAQLAEHEAGGGEQDRRHRQRERRGRHEQVGLLAIERGAALGEQTLLLGAHRGERRGEALACLLQRRASNEGVGRGGTLVAAQALDLARERHPLFAHRAQVGDTLPLRGAVAGERTEGVPARARAPRWPASRVARCRASPVIRNDCVDHSTRSVLISAFASASRTSRVWITQSAASADAVEYVQVVAASATTTASAAPIAAMTLALKIASTRVVDRAGRCSLGRAAPVGRGLRAGGVCVGCYFSQNNRSAVHARCR